MKFKLHFLRRSLAFLVFFLFGTALATAGDRGLIVPLDIATVTTGGTAVTALNAGNRTAGGFLITSNPAGICVSENGTAGTTTGYSGTTMTVCVTANQPYWLAPTQNAVSVNSTASGVQLSGEGRQ